jgi:hypothetical protein
MFCLKTVISSKKKYLGMLIRSSLYFYLYSEAVSSYISGEKLMNLRSRNPKLVHVRRMNFAMCLLVAALSLLQDTAEPQIHLAEKFRTKRYGEGCAGPQNEVRNVSARGRIVAPTGHYRTADPPSGKI